MSRTLEPGISMLTAAEIRVVVVPIGPMPRDTFEAYLEVLNAHRHVPLNATASFHQCGPKSPFPHLPYKTGAMHFRFLQAEDARRRSRVCDLHVQRNVVAVLGLLHCPLVEDLAAAHSEFGRTVRQWPEALVARCVAFEPSPSHLATPTAKLQDLMVLPAGHLDQHLEVYMHEFAAAVLTAVEEHLLNANVSSIKLNTYVDSGEFLGSLVQIEEGLRKLNINEEEVKEKKRWGRLQKSKGDWSLLVGAPKDAFEHYKSAMELSRAAGDAIWYGAAVEGLAHARVLEALLTARLAASSGSHGRPGSTRSSPAVSPTKAAAGGDAPSGLALPPPDVGASSSSLTPASHADGSNDAPGGGPAPDAAHASARGQAGTSPFAAASEGPDETAGPVAAVASQGAGTDTLASGPQAADGPGTPSEASRAASLPALGLPPSPTAAAATAAAAAQLARRRSVGSSAGAAAVLPNYSLSGQGFCVMLSSADLEGEVRELMDQAKGWYEKKGGALPLQIEQSVKLCRFLACIAAGTAASAAASSGSSSAAGFAPAVEALRLQLKSEVDAAVGFILKNLPQLSLMEDRAIALAEAAQLLGLSGCGRKRLLLLWTALDLVRTGGSGPAAVAAGSGVSGAAVMDLGPAAGAAVDVWGLLRLALTAMEPPDQPGQQDPDDVAKVHWSIKRFISWQQQHMQTAATTATAPGQQQGSSGSSSSATAQHSLSQMPWQQQQFQQLLGLQLQLLTPAQAAALEGPCLLQQTTVKPRQPGSPSKLSIIGSTAAAAGGQSASDAQQQQQQQQQAPAGFGMPIGVLAGLLNPGNQQQWMPGGGCLWDSLQAALLEVLVNVARVANAPVDAWEAAAALLREYYPLLPQSLQSSLMEGLGASGAALGTRLRLRPGPGPGPQVQLKRVVPGPACLQPQHLSAALTAGSCGGGSTLRRGEGAAASGPFIYDPYAAKRKGQTAAAAAQAALPEWVCGEEGRVEVVLVNPCATPLKLDGLQLQVQPQAVPAGTSAPAGSSSSAAVQQRSVSVMLAAGSKPLRVLLSYIPSRPGYMAITGVQAMSKGVCWHQPFVQLQAAAGTSGGGAAAAAAVAASAVVAAAAGRDLSKPQGCFTVLVQPPLPLIKASLQGPEVQLTLPSEEDLSIFTAATATANTGTAPSGTSWSSAAVSPAAAGSSGVGVSGADLEKKAASVVVFEGQTLTWTLTLTNVSSQPITGCQVTVLNAKGATLKPQAQQWDTAGQQQQQGLLPPPTLTGAYLEVQAQGLAAALPLNPGASLSLPVTVVVGKPPDKVLDAGPVQVCIAYHGTATSSGSSEGSGGELLGRSLTVPIKLAVQSTIQVKSMRFLQQGLPLRNGARDDIILSKPQRLLLQTLRESRDHAAAAGAGGGAGISGSQGVGAVAGGALRRGASHHVRNNSEGSVPVAGLSVGPVIPLPSGAAAPAQPSAQLAPAPLDSIPSGISLAAEGDTGAAAGLEPMTSPVKQVAVASRTPAGTAAAASAAGGSLAVCSEPVLELVVRNASDRYFRTWLGCTPDRLSADKALSTVAVLEPGDTVKLAALVPNATHAPAAASAQRNGSPRALDTATIAGSSGSSAVAVAVDMKEPPRLAAAEALVGRLVVCWEMITGAAAAGVLPHGCVPLQPLDVAANLTPVAWSALCPSPLHVRLSVPAAAAGPASQAPSHMIDLATALTSSSSVAGSTVRTGQRSSSAGAAGPSSSSSSAAAVGLSLPGMTGPIWGLHMKVGQYLVFDLEVSCASGAATPTAQTGSNTLDTWNLQVTLFALDALANSNRTISSIQQPGTLTAGAAAGAAVTPTSSLDKTGSYAAALLAGQTLGPRGFAAVLGGAATPKAADAARNGSTGAAAALPAAGTGSGDSLIDPGVLLTGCYSKLQVVVKAGSQHTFRMHALLVQPGLYVLGVADVQQYGVEAGQTQAVAAGSTPSASVRAKAAAAGADSSAAGRVYYNQDRLYVLVTR